MMAGDTLEQIKEIIITENALEQLLFYYRQSEKNTQTIKNALTALRSTGTKCRILKTSESQRPIWCYQLDSATSVYFTIGEGFKCQEIRIGVFGTTIDENSSFFFKNALYALGEAPYFKLPDEISLIETREVESYPSFPSRKVDVSLNLESYINPEEADILKEINKDEETADDLCGCPFRILKDIRPVMELPLRLSPKQKQLLFSERPLFIQGVAGSGKTTILTHFAHQELVRTNNKVNILFIAFTDSLKGYIEMLLKSLSTFDPVDFSHIEIYSWRELCNMLAEKLGQPSFHWFDESMFDIGSYVHLDSKCNFSVMELQEFIRGVLKGNATDPKNPLIENKEFISMPDMAADQYMSRKKIYELAEIYQFRLDANNLVDDIDAARKLFCYVKNLLKYDYVLVDEAHDYTMIQLRLMSALSKDVKGLIFAGDETQVVYPSYFNWEKARSAVYHVFHEDTPAVVYLNYNYRNPQPVSLIAETLLKVRLNKLDIPYSQNIQSNQAMTPEPLRIVVDREILNSIVGELSLHVGSLGIIMENVQKMEIEGIEIERIFTPQTVKGLEFNVVCLINFNKLYSDIVIKGRTRCTPRELFFKFNEVYVSVTRTRGQLLLIDLKPEVNGLWDDPTFNTMFMTVTTVKELVKITTARFKIQDKGAWQDAALDFEKQKAFASAGECWERAGMPERAASAYENANRFDKVLNIYLAINKPDVIVDYYIKLKKFDLAAKVFHRANQFEQAASFWIKAGNHFEAARNYQALAESNDNPQIWLQAAKEYNNAKKYKFAAHCFEKSQKWSQAAASYEQDKEWEKAAVCHEKITNWLLAARCYKKYNNREKEANCYVHMMKWGQAATCFERTEKWEQAAECYAQIRLWEKTADCFERIGKFEEAVKYYERIEKWEQVAKCYKKMKKWAEAAKHFESLNRWESAADCYKQLEQWKQVALCFERLSKWGEAAQYYERIGEGELAVKCYEKNNMWENAVIYYEQFQQWENAAICYEKLGKWKQAAQLYERIAQWEKVGKCYEKNKEWEKAIAYFEQCEQWEKVAKCYAKLGKWEQAEKYYKQFLKDSKRKKPHNYRSEIEENVEFIDGKNNAEYLLNQQKGINDLIDSLKLSKNWNVLAKYYKKNEDWLNAANCYEQQGQWKQVAYCYRKANGWGKAIVFYKRIQDWKNVAECYEKMENWEQAAQYFERSQNWEQTANCYKEMEKWGLAAEFFERSQNWEQAAKYYELIGQWREAARCYKKNGLSQKATECLDKRVKQLKEKSESYNWLIYVELAKKNIALANELNEEIFKLTKMMHIQQASQHLEVAERTNIAIENLEIKCRLYWKEAAKFYENIGVWEQAANCFESAKCWELAGIIYKRIEKWEKAAVCFKNAEQWENAILCFKHCKNCMQNMKFIKKDVELNDRNTLNSIVVCFEKTDRWHEAANIWKILDMPNKAAYCYEEANDWLKAEKIWQKLRESIKVINCYEHEKTWNKAAKLCTAYKKYEQAAHYWVKAGKFSKAAISYIKAGQYKQVRLLYENINNYGIKEIRLKKICRKIDFLIRIGLRYKY